MRKQIKKIGKTYDLIEDTKLNESTPDFDIWTELLVKRPKITSEIKNPLKR